jgi:hypothetical protein
MLNFFEKIMRKSLFNYSFYSQSEMEKFQGVTPSMPRRAAPPRCRAGDLHRRGRRRRIELCIRGVPRQAL